MQYLCLTSAALSLLTALIIPPAYASGKEARQPFPKLGVPALQDKHPVFPRTAPTRTEASKKIPRESNAFFDQQWKKNAPAPLQPNAAPLKPPRAAPRKPVRVEERERIEREGSFLERMQLFLDDGHTMEEYHRAARAGKFSPPEVNAPLDAPTETKKKKWWKNFIKKFKIQKSSRQTPPAARRK